MKYFATYILIGYSNEHVTLLTNHKNLNKRQVGLRGLVNLTLSKNVHVERMAYYHLQMHFCLYSALL